MITYETFNVLKEKNSLSNNEYDLLLEFIVNRNAIKERISTMVETLKYSKQFFSLHERITIINSFRNNLDRVLVFFKSCESNEKFLRKVSNI